MNLEDIRKRHAATTRRWIAEGRYISAKIPGGRPNGEIVATFGTTSVCFEDIERDIRNATWAAHSWQDIDDLLKRLAAAEAVCEALVTYSSILTLSCHGTREWIQVLKLRNAWQAAAGAEK